MVQQRAARRRRDEPGRVLTYPPAEPNGRMEQIVDAAVRVFCEKGYHESSIQDIADAAGLGKSSLYHYIQSKEQLLFEIHESFIVHLVERVEALANSDLPPREKLEAIVVDAVESVARYKPYVTVFFAEMRSLGSERLARITAKRDAYEQVLTDVIRDGIRQGAFASEDPKLVSLSLLGMVNWCYQWLRSDGPLSPSEVGRRMTRLVLDGLAARPGLTEVSNDGSH